MRALAFTAAIAIALIAAPAAAADILGTAQVRTAGGRLLAAAGRSSSFEYPSDGSVLSIGSVVATHTRVDLQDISMLGGRVHADRVTIRHGRRAQISGLVVQGLLRDASANKLYQLDTGSYLVVSQKAVIGSNNGYVGLRLSVAPGYPGVPQGAQLLVGLRERGNKKRNELASEIVTAAGPWASLGFGAAPSLAGLPVVTDPLLGGMLPPANGIGGRAVALAAQFLGVPYRWGGASPETGFDCSGLTMYVYGQLGVHLTHYTGAQMQEGAPVPPEALQPGDLLFFDAGAFGVPGHEGMYVGGGLFIQAPHTGDVVKISPLAAYANRYVGAVRPY